MKFAKNVFRAAGIYGLGLAVLYFAEGYIARHYPPAITHPEFFYGFIGAVVVFHIAFLVMATDPLRYRPLMPVAALEKFVFGLPTVLLFLQGRAPFPIAVGAVVDLGFGVLFIAAYRFTAAEASAAGNLATPTAPA